MSVRIQKPTQILSGTHASVLSFGRRAGGVDLVWRTKFPMALLLAAAVMVSAAQGTAEPISCILRDSPPIKITKNGQIIEHLRVESRRGPAISVKGYRNVVIRNVEIIHRNGPGIEFENAHNLLIENVSVTFRGPMRKGAAKRADFNNIAGESSDSVVIRNVRLTNGSSGIYLVRSNRARLRFIEGYDMRGPLPRGQLVQFNMSHNCLLEDFSAINRLGHSWVEDNISVYQSSNCVIRRGLLSGNDSPSGVGVMVEQVAGKSSGVLVEDVDAVRQGNGCFSAYPGFNITFRRTRCRDNICSDQGRGKPLSNALGWAGLPGSQNLRIEHSTHFAMCNPTNIVWRRATFSKVQLREAAFKPRSPIRNKFCWKSTRRK